MNILFKGKIIKKQIKNIQRISYPGADESAGIIFGYFEDNNCYITHLINRTSNASFASSDFSYNGHPPLYVRYFRWKTRKMTRYIGTWHTHPTFEVKPSKIDVATMEKVIKDLGISANPFLIFNQKHIGIIIYIDGKHSWKEVSYESIKYKD